MMKILVTGGAGFIGSALIRYLIEQTPHTVLCIDKLTYAGHLETLTNLAKNDRFFFEMIDICSFEAMQPIYQSYQPDFIMHLAAETHVDRSIENASDFIKTNIIGTYVLLELSRAYYVSLSQEKKMTFRFHHISTDEVYGDLDSEVDYFTENSSYAPNSPYSASKASSDHFVRAWYRTYGLPIIITCCSNNYGPYQHPEKLIPLTILNALAGKAIPVYGDGLQIRDWLYVDDHVRALYQVITKGSIGETYNIGGHNEKTNIDVICTICNLLDDMVPIKPIGLKHYSDLITHVSDRAGHDKRYAIDTKKIFQTLAWVPEEQFESGLKKTIRWYIDNLTSSPP